MVSNLNKGIVKPYPEFFAINKSLGGGVLMSEIICLRLNKPVKKILIPELKPEIKFFFQKAERSMDPNILGIIQR